MRTAKVRKHDKKRKRKTLSATRTDKSRQRRLDNKAKRDAIHAINPDAKIIIVDGITYMNGVKVKVINGQIKSHLNTEPLLNEPIDVFEPEPEIVVASDEGEVNVIEKIEAHNKSAIQRLTDKLRKK